MFIGVMRLDNCICLGMNVGIYASLGYPWKKANHLENKRIDLILRFQYLRVHMRTREMYNPRNSKWSRPQKKWFSSYEYYQSAALEEWLGYYVTHDNSPEDACRCEKCFFGILAGVIPDHSSSSS